MSTAESSGPPGEDSQRWTEVRVDVPAGWQELVAETLQAAAGVSARLGGADGDESSPAPDHERVRIFLPTRRDDPALRAELRRVLAGLSAATGAAELADLAPTFHERAGRDWDAVWRASWRPFRVGRLCVVPPWPPWSERVLRAADVRLRLAPGGVFGTGRHATTRTCLRLLQELVAREERVLDAGSGSGILSVAAALLGAREVLGFDVDDNAAPSAAALARDNGVEARCAFRTGGFEVLEREGEPFDGLVANIYADVLVAQAGRLAAHLAPGGWFLFSGIEARHLGAVERAYAAAGLQTDERRRVGRWCTLAGRRSRRPLASS